MASTVSEATTSTGNTRPARSSDGAEEIEGFVGEGLDVVVRGDVAHHAVGVDTGTSQLVYRLVKGRLLDVGQHEPRPAPAQLLCGGEPDPARPSGDDCSASGELV